MGDPVVVDSSARVATAAATTSSDVVIASAGVAFSSGSGDLYPTGTSFAKDHPFWGAQQLKPRSMGLARF